MPDFSASPTTKTAAACRRALLRAWNAGSFLFVLLSLALDKEFKFTMTIWDL